MAIKLSNLKLQEKSINDNNTEKIFYTDLHLDLTMQFINKNQLFKQYDKKDLLLDINLEAIKNSIVNIFNTIPGSKILNPEFGLNLNQYLFEPLNEETAKNIGEAIYSTLVLYEPRINVTNINVSIDYENLQYLIDLYFTLPNISGNYYHIKQILSQT